MKTFNKLMTAVAGAVLIFGLASCNKDAEKGNVNVSMTDAPADDEKIKGVFVTVASVYVDGEEVEGYTPQTIEISAYQNGSTYALISDEVEAKSYSQIQLELDYENDANGNSPGCYVENTDGNKEKLKPSDESSNMITVRKSFDVATDNTTNLVVDMDLRKSVRRDNNGSYSFGSSAELESSFRMVDKDNSGKISGKVQGEVSSDEKVIVYAYKKGEYSDSETEISSETDVRFKKAVTSAQVDASGNYNLSFLEEGDYEIHVARYQVNSENEVVFDSELNVQSMISGLLLSNISVEANASLTLDLSLIL